jgi:hypothetical protein
VKPNSLIPSKSNVKDETEKKKKEITQKDLKQKIILNDEIKNK